MELKCVIIFSVSFVWIFNLNSYAYQLEIGSAVAGKELTINCSTTNGNVQFTRGLQNVVSITGEYSNGSCILEPKYITEYVYKCDKKNHIYSVLIPGSLVESQHKSTWKCSSVFGGNVSDAKIYVKVPVTSLTLRPADKNVVTVVENVQKSLTCTTNPIRPSGRIQWYIDGKNVTSLAVSQPDTIPNDTMVISSSILTYAWNRSTSAESIYCTASNIKAQLPVTSNNTSINVQFGPSIITLLPPNQSYTVRENNSIPDISCTASCNPQCTCIWTCPRKRIDNNILKLSNMNRQLSGNYTCTANNSIGSINRSIFILVQYPATVKSLVSSTGNFTVNENSNVTLTCTVEGEPAPKISWHVNSLSGGNKLTLRNGNKESTLLIAKAQCEDTGIYTCSVENGFFPSRNKIQRFDIACIPRQNKSCSSKQTLRIEMHKLDQVFVCFTSNPAPEVTWTFISDTNITLNSSTSNTTFVLFKSVPNIFDIPENQILSVEAKNIYGKSNVEFNISIIQSSTQKQDAISKTSDRLAIISGAAGASLAVLIICLIVITALKRRNRQTKEHLADNKSSVLSNRGYVSEESLPVYAKDKKPQKRHIRESVKDTPIYAEVNKKVPINQSNNEASSIYAMVQKKKSKKKESCNSSESFNMQSSSKNKDESGLVYVQVSFEDTHQGKKFTIKEPTERTEYGEIDFTQKADPLPNDNEEENLDNFTY